MPQNNYHLHLKGFVGGYDFDSSYVDFVLAKNKDEAVNVLIDSLGGSVSTALSIASAFNNHGNVNVHFVGMNASAATIASLGAKQISMDSSAMYLVHKCSAEFFKWDNLNADGLDALIAQCMQMKSDLEKLDANIAQMYAEKCKKSKEELLDLMKVGGWLNAQEALDWGFIDEITHFGEEAPVLTDAVASAMASAGIPIPNIETEKDSPFMTFFRNLFRNNIHEPKIINKMEIKTTLLADALHMTGIEAVDGMVQLTAEQVQTIDGLLNQNKTTMANMQAEIDALKQKPADTTMAVVDDKKGSTNGRTEVEQYIDTVNSAKSLYNMV